MRKILGAALLVVFLAGYTLAGDISNPSLTVQCGDISNPSCLVAIPSNDGWEALLNSLLVLI